jgi:hypothetical protein
MLKGKESRLKVLRVRANQSFNADVPHAGLFPRSGPPVSLFR